MFSAVDLILDALCASISRTYDKDYGLLYPEFPKIACWAARMALENIRHSDALYHDVEHTALVADVGMEILSGKQIRDGGVTPHDWLNFTVALVCHDIGYVRGVLREDRKQAGSFQTGVDDQTIELGPGKTDASLAPHHVDRGKRFIQERFGEHRILDAQKIGSFIEYSRFPVPLDGDHDATDNYPGLLRAADLIGQLADPRYLAKLPALFYEFQETGTNEILGYKTPEDLRRNYPSFFWNTVRPYIGDAVRYLRVTARGYQWVANLHSVVFDASLEEL